MNINHTFGKMSKGAQEMTLSDRELGESSGRIAATLEAIATVEALQARISDLERPIDMVLHCPECGAQHIDEPERSLGSGNTESVDWTNPPHRTHLCHSCGHKWRPADVATNGVAAVRTRGKDDSPISDLRAVFADADRMRWILAGNGYFLEESSLPGSANDARERDFMRQKIDEYRSGK